MHGEHVLDVLAVSMLLALNENQMECHMEIYGNNIENMIGGGNDLEVNRW